MEPSALYGPTPAESPVYRTDKSKIRLQRSPLMNYLVLKAISLQIKPVFCLILYLNILFYNFPVNIFLFNFFHPSLG